MELKRTALYSSYKDFPGCKLVDFGGWELPIQFKDGIIKEHMRVRESAGLFDVSHMGELLIQGESAWDFLRGLLTAPLPPQPESGRCYYSPMCYENGGTVDDLIVYAFNAHAFWLVVNAANREKDLAWLDKAALMLFPAERNFRIEDISHQTAQLALQGPRSVSILQQLTKTDLSGLRPFRFMDKINIASVSALVSRTGYTGEDGFEIYCQTEEAPLIWKALLELEDPPEPCGLGARDSLRLEAAMPLYGHELSAEISPLEAGLDSFVDKQRSFIGAKALLGIAVGRKLYGIKMIDGGVPREDCEVFYQDEKIGRITSGTRSPYLKEFIALALLDKLDLQETDTVLVKIRNKKKKAQIVKLPFYKRRKNEYTR